MKKKDSSDFPEEVEEEIDDFGKDDGHPTKRALRPRIKYYYTETVVSKPKRRALEKRLKKDLKFNKW